MTQLRRLLIANRGEIAIRIQRAAERLGVEAVTVYSRDDAGALHRRRAARAAALAGDGPAAYLDIEQLVAAAREHDCDALHPGYGFLSESAELARACAAADVVFVGPDPAILELLGDKARARVAATAAGLPVLDGSSGPLSLDEAEKLLADHPAGIVLKAVAGGGGRGMRVVTDRAELESAFRRCASEARKAFGREELYAERLLTGARHIEVQIAGDGSGTVCCFGERDCSLQRRHQKLVEIAPAPNLHPAVRQRLLDGTRSLAADLRYRGLGTFEFLVEEATAEDGRHWFIEANPRLQVEHPVTEEVFDVDLVALQLQLAAGRSLAEVGFAESAPPAPRGLAIEARLNLESVQAGGGVLPASGELRRFELASGPGIRVDTCGYAGLRPSPRFDSLLAKIVVHERSGDLAAACRGLVRALAETAVEGIATNAAFLSDLLQDPGLLAGELDTGLVDRFSVAWEPQASPEPAVASEEASRRAGARLQSGDPLAVLAYGKSDPGAEPSPAATAAAVETAPAIVDPSELERGDWVVAPMQGTIVELSVTAGDEVGVGQELLIMEAMKMEHVIAATSSGVVERVTVAVGDTVYQGHPLLVVEAAEVQRGEAQEAVESDPTAPRDDLVEVRRRQAFKLDENRPEAVAKRRKLGMRTARENVEDLCDEGSFVEYGSLVIAARRRRTPLAELIERTPADGLITGIGNVNGALVGADRARCCVLSYDYTVLAGTQGKMNHEKKDRMFEIAERQRLPLVFFTEGGGGRPGDTDVMGVAGLDCMAFHLFGRLSGLVPLVGVNNGRCFAGNAALLGCCDVVIATRNSSIGMGGPAMIEGGGLGVFRPEEVGPMEVQVPNGVVDVAVDDEAEAVRVAKQYLSYFQGRTEPGEHADQELLRGVIPEHRKRMYDVRRVIELLADRDSVLELRRGFGHGMITALVRIDGRPLGIVANNPAHLAGAIDSPGADKAARFMQLCDAFDLPLLFLADTPGMMVGPEVEKTALVRHCSRMFVVGASLTVPFFTIVLRKSYGLGAQAMAGGSFKAPLFAVSWPTGEFGGMGLEGAVKLGFRNELAAIEDPAERQETFERMVAEAYDRGKALNTASHFEIDDVIDPAESRRWILRGLDAAAPPAPRTGKKRPCIDTW